MLVSAALFVGLDMLYSFLRWHAEDVSRNRASGPTWSGTCGGCFNLDGASASDKSRGVPGALQAGLDTFKTFSTLRSPWRHLDPFPARLKPPAESLAKLVSYSRPPAANGTSRRMRSRRRWESPERRPVTSSVGGSACSLTKCTAPLRSSASRSTSCSRFDIPRAKEWLYTPLLTTRYLQMPRARLLRLPLNWRRARLRDGDPLERGEF